MDRQWWEVHLDEVNRTFKGVRYSTNPLPPQFLTKNLSMEQFPAYGNSGAACLTLAQQAGAARVIMLGYDCQFTNNQAHWHGNHPRTLDNAKYVNTWPAKFAKQAADLMVGIEVINCSRATALDCYPRAKLEDVL